MLIYSPNGNAEVYPYSIGHLRKDNPNVSFPFVLTDTTLADHDVFPVERTEPPKYDSITQSLTEDTPVLVGGVWKQVWVITDATTVEVEQRTNDLASSIRSKRDGLLTSTDWVVVLAYERNESVPPAVSEYRQGLRDLTAQASFPSSVVWPTKP